MVVRGVKYKVKGGKLDLHNKRIVDITEIKGLKALTHLHDLNLRMNQIKEIKGLEHLTQLETLYLVGNPIRDDERHLMRKRAQEIVRYCEENVEMVDDRLKDF